MVVKSNVSKLFTAGNRAARIRRSTVPALTVDQFKLDQALQVTRMIDTGLGAFPGHLFILTQHRRQLQVIRSVL